jgi:hypothetical protein
MQRIFKLTTPVVIITLFGLFSMQLLQSCKKRIQYIDGAVVPFENNTKVTASIFGRVVDESGAAVSSATVTSGSNTTTTDVNGLFFFRNIQTPQHASTVIVRKANYFAGSRTLMVKAGQTHTVKVTLLARGLPETFTAYNGGAVSFGSGLNLTFNPNSIVYASNGNEYTGQVFVYAKTVNPSSDPGRNAMPGDLRGITQETGEERVLKSFGMVAAELTDVSGNTLQLKNGEQALMNMAIPSGILGTPPTSIPMWYFDETSGMWQEESIAHLKNGRYEGPVNHFSFWNYDQPAASINLELTLTDQNNNPLQGYTVKITNSANFDTRTGTTNNNGWVGGLVYANANLLLEVFDINNVCSSVIPLYTQNIPTSTVNINLGTIPVTLPALANSSVEGTVLDCTNLPIGNSVVFLSPMNILITPDPTTGYFTYTLPCVPTSPVTITAYDLGNLVNGDTTITMAVGNNSLGNVYACGDVTPYLIYTLTNTTTSNTQNNSFYSPVDTISAVVDTNASVGAYSAVNNYFGWVTDDTVAGTFAPLNVGCYPGMAVFTDNQYTVQTGSSVTYTSFPMFPGHVLGSFNIILTGMPSGNTYTAVGTFRAPRKN